jgi:hypothetical protein
VSERDRIRAKLSDTDKDFLDALRRIFPGARLRYIRFSDGEEIGRRLKEENHEKN